MTLKIYYDNPYQFDFQAKVVRTVQKNGRWGVILDQTCFYPQGGGQPADRGFLNESTVYDVQLEEAEIIHYIDRPISDNSVHGRVDKVRRFDFMQQHTGQHILSQSLLRVGKWNTVSVHFGEDYVAIETDAADIPLEKYGEVERVANQIVLKNVAVKIEWVDPAEVERFHIRRPPPDVKKVRIVQVGDFDASACGGLHVSSTGEVGLIKIIGEEKIRGHIRIHALIGQRAFADYHRKMKTVQNLCCLLSCGEDSLIQRVQDMAEQLKDAQRNLARIQAESMASLAKETLADAIKIGEILFVHRTFDHTDNKLLKVFVDSVLSESGRIVVALSRNGEQVNWMVGHSLVRPLNLIEFCAPLLAIIDAKGGGKPDFVQGGGKKAMGIPQFIGEFKQKIEKELYRHE